MPSKYILEPLLPDKYYHIYNRGNNGEKIFYIHEHYQYFMRKYLEKVGPYVQTFAFCLLPNHFHFLIRIKTSEELKEDIDVSNQFRKLFISYSMFINSVEGRKGALFTKNFKKIEVITQDYLKRLVFYIHFNPEKHKIVTSFENYRYCSFLSILCKDFRFISGQEVLYWFNNDINELKDFHNHLKDERKIKDLIIEDF